MFRTHWGLRESPFRGALDARHFFASPTHEEALARLHFLVEERRRLGLLFGGPGSGKSMVLEVFARRMRRSGAQLANINLLGIDLHEFLWLTAAELGLNPDRRDDVFRLWRGISDRLAENRYQQLNTLLLLDDADEASPQVLDHVVRLSQMQNSASGCLTIVLAAADDHVRRITPRLLELAELRIDICPWEAADTADYIAATLRQAGRDEQAFTDDALLHLHELSGGVPRRVNQLAHLALLAGAGRQVELVDCDTLDSVYQELGVVSAVA